MHTRALYILAAVFYFYVTSSASAIPIRPAGHPNHFILLVDSSAPPRATALRAALFRETLDTALKQMYQDGFEGRVPPFDPQSDLITIEHFGVTTGEPATAYLHLNRINFLREFIRVAALRERNMTVERAAKLAWPDQYNRLTLLGWARPLGLLAAAPRDNSATPVARTFLVVITDEIANNTDLSAELAMLRTRGRHDHVAEAEAAIRKIRDQYRLGDADGNPGALWHYTMPDRTGTEVDAIELYEVTANDTRAWSAQVAALKAAGRPTFQWTANDEERPAGVLTFTPTDAFRTLVSTSADGTASVAITGHSSRAWRAEEPVPLPVVFATDAGCQPTPLQLQLSAMPTRSDPILGQVAFAVSSSVDVPVPLLPSCTTGRRMLFALIALAALLLLAAIVYWIVYSRYRTHIVIDKPAGLVRWRLRWDRPEVIRDVMLRGDLAALRVTLPPLSLRKLLYQNAVLHIRSEPPDQFQWNDSGASSLSLNGSTAEQALVHWRKSDAPARAATLRVELHNRNRIASFEANPGMEMIDV